MEGLGRAFDGAGVAFNTRGEAEFGITYPGPSDATMTRIWGAFHFAPRSDSQAKKFCAKKSEPETARCFIGCLRMDTNEEQRLNLPHLLSTW